MHIGEAILSAPVLAGGAVLAAGGVAAGLRKMDYAKIPEVAVLTSAFFVASLIRVPLGPASVHLVLNGLLGVLIGWMSFPAIFVALTLQAVLFQFGGITTLGINTLNMALPAVAAYYVARPLIYKGRRAAAVGGFIAGVVGVGGAIVLIVTALILTGKEFTAVAKTYAAISLPSMVVEGVVTAFILLFLMKVKPGILDKGDK